MQVVTVGELMTQQVYAVGAETAGPAAARMMVEQGITGCPVVDWVGRPMGIVSLTDIVDPDRVGRSDSGLDVHFRISGGAISGYGTGMKVEGGQVGDVMTAEIICLREDATVEDAAELMVFNHIHRILITRQNRVVGILTSLDITRGFLERAVAVRSHALAAS